MPGLAACRLPLRDTRSHRPAHVAASFIHQQPISVSAQVHPQCNCLNFFLSNRTQFLRFDPEAALLWCISRKEVIQPHLPIRLPCYDFTPVTNPAVVIAPLAVRLTTSGRTRSHGVTGGVYKTRERIHRGKLIRDY